MTTTHAQMILDHIGTMDQASLRAAMEDGELLGRLMTELDLTDAEMQAAAEEIHAFTRPGTRSRDMTSTQTDHLYIISGEGEQGHREEYTGKMTLRAIRARLTRERAHGDRWARLETETGEPVSDTALEYFCRQ